MGKLNSDTLVLNRSWLAVQVCSVKRAICLLYQGHAKAIDDDFNAYDFSDWVFISQEMDPTNEDEFVHSSSIRMRIPRVIVLTLYDKLPSREVRFSRKNIFERDNYTCQYCGKRPPSKSQALKWIDKNQLNLDHIIPRARGGKTTWLNVVTSCYKCNSKKGSKLLEELGWKLLSTPKVPNWKPTLQIPCSFTTHREWGNFLDIGHWNNTNLDIDNEE